ARGPAVAESVVRRGCGEIGKHARFRAWWAQALEGSSPFSRIPLIFHARLSTPGRAYPRAPFHTGARLSTRAFPHRGALIHARLSTPGRAYPRAPFHTGARLSRALIGPPRDTSR